MTTRFDAPDNNLNELTQYIYSATYRAHVIAHFGPDWWNVIIEFSNQSSLRLQLERLSTLSGKRLEELTEFLLLNSQINVLPGNAANMFMDISLNLKSLVQATFPEGFLSPAQNAIL